MIVNTALDFLVAMEYSSQPSHHGSRTLQGADGLHCDRGREVLLGRTLFLIDSIVLTEGSLLGFGSSVVMDLLLVGTLSSLP